MAEMDIYMRRRLVALGGLVLFFILFVLLVKSCGGEDEPATVTPETVTGTTGGAGAALSVDDYILRADEICGPANDQVGSLDPADPGAIQDEYNITRDELAGLQTLDLAEPSQDIERFLSDLSAVVSALKTKAKAADPAAQDAAQLAIDTAEVDARKSGEDAGFRDCGAFLDAGDGPAGGGGGGGGATDDTTVAPPVDDTTVAPPVDDTTVAPPADDGTVTPPVDDGTGNGGGGGITP